MKILILSHNPITDYNSMGKTLLALFDSFSPKEICQLYLYPTLPNLKICSGYYRVTDKEVLKSILRRNHAGKVIEDGDIHAGNPLYENPAEARLYAKKTHHRELKLIVRDCIWKLGAWFSQTLKQWLREQKPDVIFAAAGASSFFYDVILRIASFLNIPIISYVCDDFYFTSENVHNYLMRKMYSRRLQKKIRRLMSHSAKVVTICDSLKEEYHREFDCKTVTVFSGCNCEISNEPIDNRNGVMAYFGNLQLNRNHSLRDIGLVLDKINESDGANYQLKIFTGDTAPEFTDVFANVRSVRLMGFISGDEVHRQMRQVTLLTHVESFAPQDVQRIRYSLSTKIADSLASGVCLFAYGPAQVASIQYLSGHDCAGVVSAVEDLEKSLRLYLTGSELRRQTAQKGLQTAELCHRRDTQSTLLKTILEEVVYENNAD